MIYVVMRDTNANASFKAYLKSCISYVLSRSKRMNIVQLTYILVKMDGDDAPNVLCENGLYCKCALSWKRLPQKGRKVSILLSYLTGMMCVQKSQSAQRGSW